MNKIIYIIIFLFLQLLSWSQDTIRFRNGASISAKVLEVNSSAVKYKLFTNIDGPDYVKDKNDILFIKYLNGLTDSIQQIEPLQNTFSNICKISYKVDKINRRYYFTDINREGIRRPIGVIEIMNISKKLAKEEHLKDLLRLTKKTKRNIRQSVGCFAFGISIIAVGGMMCVTSLMEYPNAYKTQAQVDETRKLGVTIGLSSLAVGLSFETLSIVIKRKRKKTVSDLVNLYNKYSK